MSGGPSFAGGSWIDITIPIRPGMPVFPGDPPVRIELAQAIAEGASCNVTRLDMGAHTGTHIDAPVHFIQGASGADGVPTGSLLGALLVRHAAGDWGDLGAEGRRANDRAVTSGARIVSAFKNAAAAHLIRLARPVVGDVFLASDDAPAKAIVARYGVPGR